MDPNLFKLANIIHQERLQEAAAGRHARRAETPSSGLLQRAGEFLIAAGQKLKARGQPNAAASILALEKVAE
jgi:hypothetical protein